MGKKAKRWRSRANQLQASVKRKNTQICDAAVAMLSAKESTEKLVRELNDLRRRVDEGKILECFRAAIRNMQFGRMGGDIFSLQVTFDPRMIEYGVFMGSRNGPTNISRELSFIVRDLCAKIERELHKQIAERGGLIIGQIA